MNSQVKLDSGAAIAIVGMVGKFPGSVTLGSYWKNLVEGRETISHFSEEELLAAGVDGASLANPNYVRARGVYKDPMSFDASFFGYTPRDAELLDPQQRVFLECCWEALENAGYDSSRFPGRIGVFAGSGITHYLFEIMHRPEFRKVSGFNMVTANDKDYIATRVGYKLNLKGPCVTVQTACSTSMVATVLGCQSLLTYQSDMVLAGGASIYPIEVGGYDYQEGGIVSPDGHCRSFDAAAKGTIFSSGAGVLVLKRLEDALPSDHIYAIIRGFAMNNDGAQRAGFTAPGVEGQTAVTTEALVTSGIDPETVSYVECHGTATALGDPIEVQALTHAYGAFTGKKNFCAIGSVKSNIGHTDTAAGVAGIIKTVLALNHKLIPPSLHFENANPEIHFEDTPFYVNTTLRAWESAGARRAGVNSFGVGGTNAHLILDEPPVLPASSSSRPWQLLLCSARSVHALDELSRNLAEYLHEEPDVALADVAYTHQVGRRQFDHRRFSVVRSRESAIAALGSEDGAGTVTLQYSAPAPKVVFLFPGQGSQYVNMARELYESETEFRITFDTCADLFRTLTGEDLHALIWPRAADAEVAGERLQQTGITQPVLFAIEYSLAKLWGKWGVHPAAAIGHSVGEYVAACLAGVMDLETATTLVSARASLMQSLPAGSMLSVLVSESDLEALLEGQEDISIAAVNGPSACVVSGLSDRIEAFAQGLTAKNIPNRRLKTSHAFHSPMIDPILIRFLTKVRMAKLSPPRFPYLSNVTGTWIRPEEATSPEYWVQHLRQPVRFAAGVTELLRSQKRFVFLEVGPGRTLSSLVAQQTGRDGETQLVTTLPGPTHQSDSDLAAILKALGHLWAVGIEPDWTAFYSEEERRRVPTVTYPFERQVYGKAGVINAELPAEEADKPERLEFDDWFATANWSRTAALTLEAELEGSRCLLFADEEVSEELRRNLSMRGFETVVISHGPRFGGSRAEGFVTPLDEEASYSQLFAGMVESAFIPTHIVYAWGLLGNSGSSSSFDCDHLLDRSFYGPLYLIKALGQQWNAAPISIHFVSNQALDVTGSERINAVAAAVFGPATSAAREYKNLAVRVVDVVVNGSDIAGLDLLMDEISHVQTDDQIVALRGGHRWVRGYIPVKFKDPQAGAGLRENGVYLITGGLRGIGLASARFIAKQVSARLVLIGRSILPPREEWSSLLESANESEPLVERLRGVLELESLGAEVLVLAADSAAREEMRLAVAQARQRFGRINGVIHSAGLAGEGIIALKQKAAADAVLRPKIHGSIILHELLEDEPLDFFLLYSSLTGSVGSAGQVDYTAGNAFMDAFAWQKRNAANRPVTIDWDRWDDVGMAARQMREMIAKEMRGIEGRNEPLMQSIFSRRIVGKDHETYVLDISADTHWIVGEHKIVSIPTMVGSSHLEHVRAAFAHSEGTEIAELRDLIFIQPVMLRPGERREVFYSLLPGREGRRDFSIWSIDLGVRAEHARGRVGPATSNPAQRSNPAAIFARCGNERTPVMAEGVTTNGDAAIIQLSPRWDIFRRIADSPTEAIAEIRLSSTHRSDMETYMMHPAVLDCATSYASGPSMQHMYLPLAYQRLQVFKPMPELLYSHKRFRYSDAGNQEVLSCDVTLFDENGESIIEIEGFAVKRVHDPNALGPAPQTEAAAAKQAGGNSSTIAKRFGLRISPEEGVRALHRIIAGPWMPQVLINVCEGDLDERADDAHEEAFGSPEAEGGKLYPRPALATPYVAPRTELEGGIAEIWQSVLGIEKVGVQDDFIELGGHSLLAIQLTSRISETFGIEFSVADFYQESTVEGLSRSILLKLAEGMQDSSLEELLAEQPEFGATAAGD